MAMKLRALVVLVVLFSGFVWAQAYPSAQVLPLKSASFRLHDDARNKDIPIRVVYPAKSGKVPLIVFSHGAGGSGEGYTGLTDYWAQHGYICISPTHADSFDQQKEAGRHASLFSALYDSSVSPEAWLNRVKDVVFVLDSLDAIEKQAPEIKGRIDHDKIGVGGHSFGAFTAQAVGGALVQFPGEPQPKSLRDPRVKAVLLLSPQGTGKAGMVESSWKDFENPMMVMTGSRDYGDWRTMGREKEAASPEWRTEPYKFAKAGDKYLLFIKDASHMSFTGLPATQTGSLAQRSQALGIDEKAIFQWVQTGSMAFWDTYLKQEKSARVFLQNDDLAKLSNGSIKIDRK
jgi:predicted dienelactone hydrolase